MPGNHAPAKVRFWRHVSKSDNCWEWTSSIKDGYGQFKVDGRPMRAHRFSWLLHFGEIPVGLLVCHHCDNRACVRPEHLFLGTALHNHNDAVRKGRVRIPGGWRPLPPARLKGRRKLTDSDIAAIRARRGEPLRSVAKDFGVHHTTVLRLLSGAHWADIPEANEGSGAAGLILGSAMAA
jgi:hypothetical protein